MDTRFIKRIYQNLLDRKTNLTTWAEASPTSEIETRLLSSDPQVVESQLQVIDHSLCCLDEGTFGICQVCHETVDNKILELDYTACVCLDHYSEQEKRQLEAELEFSQAIQKSSLQPGVPVIPDIEVAAFSRPAAIVSGDFFDFFPFQDGAQGVAIADAVGHGVSAGMLMSSVQTALRLLAPDTSSPVLVIERINRLLLHNINFTTFVTLFLGSYDPHTHELTYANAGHNPPLLFQTQQRVVTLLYPTGAAAGLIQGFTADAVTIQLHPGDVLFLYTDGLTEAVNGQGDDFGLQRLEKLVHEQAGCSAAGLIGAVRQELEAFLGGQMPEDDITLVAIKAK